ncbi:hypothetical protein F511_05012 [Dorcoceras hygrometricum]|uniref:Uncharacterized protein n=1 Tax=Dorcoceras hygrometricum TaxID=472368 RepID=A0A2Z7AN66_9LAMI|nr:hypothetical protein F511_05012 [Dorcoceras hygrometricum]
MLAMMGGLYLSMYSHSKPAFPQIVKFSKSLAGKYSKSWNFQSFTAFLMVGSLVCFLVVIGFSYFFMVPSSQTFVNNKDGNVENYGGKLSVFSSDVCDMFDGNWVVDESYPIYNASQCPFVEHGFDCLANGRKDRGYLKWRWMPKNCEIPRFDARIFLEMLKGKRIVFVGDSLSRTQWESMICMLMTGIEDNNSVFEINGNRISKQIRHLGVRFRPYNFTVEFYRSIFLVQPGPAPKHSPKRVKATLKLDQMDDISREWIDSDVLIFNSGHWWTPTKLFDMGWYFQIGGKMKLGLSIKNGFRAALTTWQSWIEDTVNTNRTQVFFRTYESTHWSHGARQKCEVTTRPSLEIMGKPRSWITDAIITAAKSSTVPVKLLHVTAMGASRSDAHIGTWSDNPSVPDCSHWCLPGVPDAWNELLFLYLLSN